MEFTVQREIQTTVHTILIQCDDFPAGVLSGSRWEHMVGGRIQGWGTREGFVEEMIFTDTSAGVSPKIVGKKN